MISSILGLKNEHNFISKVFQTSKCFLHYILNSLVQRTEMQNHLTWMQPSDLDVQIPTVGPALIQDHVQGNIISKPVNILKLNFIKKFTTFILKKSLKHKI